MLFVLDIRLSFHMGRSQANKGGDKVGRELLLSLSGPRSKHGGDQGESKELYIFVHLGLSVHMGRSQET